jgi:hypothetical protein
MPESRRLKSDSSGASRNVRLKLNQDYVRAAKWWSVATALLFGEAFYAFPKDRLTHPGLASFEWVLCAVVAGSICYGSVASKTGRLLRIGFPILSLAFILLLMCTTKSDKGFTFLLGLLLVHGPYRLMLRKGNV